MEATTRLSPPPVDPRARGVRVDRASHPLLIPVILSSHGARDGADVRAYLGRHGAGTFPTGGQALDKVQTPNGTPVRQRQRQLKPNSVGFQRAGKSGSVHGYTQHMRGQQTCSERGTESMVEPGSKL